MDESSFILLYKSMVRPHLEYANSVWCPYKQGDIKELEKIQKRATKLVINLKKDSMSQQTNAFKATNLEIQAIAWRHDRGI